MIKEELLALQIMLPLAMVALTWHQSSAACDVAVDFTLRDRVCTSGFLNDGTLVRAVLLSSELEPQEPPPEIPAGAEPEVPPPPPDRFIYTFEVSEIIDMDTENFVVVGDMFEVSSYESGLSGDDEWLFDIAEPFVGGFLRIENERISIADETIRIRLLAQARSLPPEQCDAFLASEGFRERRQTLPCFGCHTTGEDGGVLVALLTFILGLGTVRKGREKSEADRR